jgi:hypothetical protein
MKHLSWGKVAVTQKCPAVPYRIAVPLNDHTSRAAESVSGGTLNPPRQSLKLPLGERSVPHRLLRGRKWERQSQTGRCWRTSAATFNPLFTRLLRSAAAALARAVSEPCFPQMIGVIPRWMAWRRSPPPHHVDCTAFCGRWLKSHGRNPRSRAFQSAAPCPCSSPLISCQISQCPARAHPAKRYGGGVLALILVKSSILPVASLPIITAAPTTSAATPFCLCLGALNQSLVTS